MCVRHGYTISHNYPSAALDHLYQLLGRCIPLSTWMNKSNLDSWNTMQGGLYMYKCTYIYIHYVYIYIHFYICICLWIIHNLQSSLWFTWMDGWTMLNLYNGTEKNQAGLLLEHLNPSRSQPDRFVPQARLRIVHMAEKTWGWNWNLWIHDPIKQQMLKIVEDIWWVFTWK